MFLGLMRATLHGLSHLLAVERDVRLPHRMIRHDLRYVLVFGNVPRESVIDPQLKITRAVNSLTTHGTVILVA